MADEKMCSEDDEMIYYAGLLLELPQLVYLSEFKEAWKQGNWNSTKKRSVRKIRKVFDDFNFRKSLMTRFGLSDEGEKKGRGYEAGNKRKRTNPNPIRKTKKPKLTVTTTTTTTTTTLLKVKFKLNGPSSSNGNAEKDGSSSSSGSGEIQVVAGKKRKKSPSPDALTTTTEHPTLKVTFKLSGRDGHTDGAHKDSSISSGSDVSKELCDAIASNVTHSSHEANQAPNPQSPTAEKNKPFLPDLNIPVTMIEDDLP